MPRYNPHKTAYRTTPKRHVEPPPEAKPSTAGSIPVLTENAEKDGFELKFSGKPSDVILSLFRETAFLPAPQKWHWHFKKKVWYAKRNEATREFAQLVITQASAPEPEPVVEVLPQAVPSETEAHGLQVLSAPSPSVEAPNVIPSTIEHEQFPKAQWALDVQDGSTRLGYEEWVEAKMDMAAEEAVEPPEQEQAIPSNVLPVPFRAAPEDPLAEAAVNQNPVPD